VPSHPVIPSLKPTRKCFTMTTTMMRLRQHLASPIYTSAIARIGNRAHHHRLPIAPPQKLRTSTATQNKLLLLLIVLLVCFLFFLIPTVLLPPARTMSSSSSSASDAAAASAPFEKPRAVVKKLLAESQPEGQGATVRRSIGRYPPGSGDPDFLSLCNSAVQLADPDRALTFPRLFAQA
jgi:quercetin 2,3-dioxygenase